MFFWGENNPYIRAIDLYNDLDQRMKLESNTQRFKTALKRKILEIQRSNVH